MRALSRQQKLRTKNRFTKEEFIKVLARTGNQAALDHILGPDEAFSLAKAIEGAMFNATKNFGVPDQIMMSPHSWKGLQKQLEGNE